MVVVLFSKEENKTISEVYYIMLTRPCFRHPYNISLLYCKIGVNRDIHYFLIFALKHIAKTRPCNILRFFKTVKMIIFS